MRTLAITQNITLDGCIEMLGDWFDPGDQDPELAAEMSRMGEDEEYLLLGRQTFTDFRGYWPHQSDDTTGVSEQLDRVQKLVVTSTLEDPEWQNSTLLGADWVSAVRALKEEDGGDIVTTGSIQLTHALFDAGLVDEVRLFTYPVVQGRGRRLFPDGYETGLRRLDSRAFGSGITLSTYAVP